MLYKGIENFKDSQKNISDAALQGSEPPDYDQLLEEIQNLHSYFSPNNLAFVKKAKSTLEFIKINFLKHQDQYLFSIFEEFNLFDLAIQFLKSRNRSLSIEAFSFIINFTSSNEDFAQLFIENKLLLILTDFIMRFVAQNDENNLNRNPDINDQNQQETFVDDTLQFLNFSLSILVNILDCNSFYIKRIWRILKRDIFFSIIEHGNVESLLKCAKIILASIGKTDNKDICKLAIEGLFRLLNHPFQNSEVIYFSLVGFKKYIDKTAKGDFDPDLFQKFEMQQTLEKFYSLRQINDKTDLGIKEYSLLIMGQLITLNEDYPFKIINEFRSEPLFPLLQDNQRPKLQEKAFWVLDVSIYNDILIDGQFFLDFLIQKNYQNLLSSSYHPLNSAARSIVNFLHKLNISDLMNVINNKTMMMLIIKFIQCEDNIILKRTLSLLQKLDLKKKELIKIFNDLGGNEALDSCKDSDIDIEVKILIHKFQKSWKL